MQFEHVYLMLFISWSHRNSTSRMKANLANTFNACLNGHWLNVKRAGVYLITQAFKSRFHMLNNYSLIFMACLVSEINIYSLEIGVQTDFLRIYHHLESGITKSTSPSSFWMRLLELSLWYPLGWHGFKLPVSLLIIININLSRAPFNVKRKKDVSGSRCHINWHRWKNRERNMF